MTTKDRELVLTRIIDAPRAKVYRAWTEPALLKQWFAPLPYTTPVAQIEMGFHQGWGMATDQLATLAAKL